jgi:hypothetical protein
MFRSLVKWYLVLMTLAGLAWGASHVQPWVDHNSQEEACSSISERSYAEYAATGFYADYADGSEACALNWFGVVFWGGFGFALSLIAQLPAYLYLVFVNILRRRAGCPALPPVIPAVARTYVATLTVLGALWFWDTAHELAARAIYLGHCDAYLNEESTDPAVQDAALEQCRVPTAPVLFNFGVRLAVTLALLQSPAWAYLYFRRRRAAAGPAAPAPA